MAHAEAKGAETGTVSLTELIGCKLADTTNGSPWFAFNVAVAAMRFSPGA